MAIPTLEKTTLSVCPVGMDERSHQALRLFFERQLGGSCVVADEVHAHAVMLDLDGHLSKGLLDFQLRNYPDRPLILLSLDCAKEIPVNAVLVQKPISIELLANALHNLSQRLQEQRRESEFAAAAERVAQTQLAQHRPDAAAAPPRIESSDIAALHLRSEKTFFHIGNTPDVDLAVPEQRARVYYDPADFLQGHFQRAHAVSSAQGKPVRLFGAAFQHIDIDAHSGRAMTPAPASTLYAAARQPIAGDQVSIEVLTDPDRAFAGGERIESAEAMLWRLTLWASRGRVPVATDLEWPVFLKRWPNLTRLLAPPHATRIASLWVRQPFSLASTVTTLGVPQRLVFAFYSACAAQGLSAPTRRAADVLVVPEIPKPSEKRSLFKLLLNKLMRDWGD